MGTITAANFQQIAFESSGDNQDLRSVYLAAGGGPGTYIRSGTSNTWMKQQ
jgi:hypothetical protein